MTSPPDVQNVPDVWALLEQARDLLQRMSVGKPPLDCAYCINAALAQRDRFVLVPKEPDDAMIEAGAASYRKQNGWLDVWDEMLAAVPKPLEKP